MAQASSAQLRRRAREALVSLALAGRPRAGMVPLAVAIPASTQRHIQAALTNTSLVLRAPPWAFHHVVPVRRQDLHLQPVQDALHGAHPAD